MRLLLCLFLCAVMIFSCLVAGCGGTPQLNYQPDNLKQLLISVDGAWPAALAWEQCKQSREIDSGHYRREDSQRRLIKTLEKNLLNPEQILRWPYIPTPQEQWGYNMFGYLVFTPAENFLPSEAKTPSPEDLLLLKEFWGIED